MKRPTININLDKLNKSIKKEEINNIKYIEIKTFYPLHGAIFNYYHFCMSSLIPIILDSLYYQKKNIYVVFIINDNFGPMLRILLELPIDIKMKKYMLDYDELFNQNKIEQKLYASYDIHPKDPIRKYDLSLIKKDYAKIINYDVIKKIQEWFNISISKFNLNITEKYDILIIERKINKSYDTMKLKNRNKTHDTKKNDYIKIVNKLLKVSGKETRSIINHKEFVEFIKNKYKKKKILNISLEYISIFDQFILFNNAKIIFAQHGASLTNIIFMKPKTKLIEIIDTDKYQHENWFIDIGKASKIDHYQYITESPHVNIDLDDFKKFLMENKI
jgi:hypothetical protein